MMRFTETVVSLCLLHTVIAVKVKVVMRSQEDSKIDEDDTVHTEPRAPMLPFLKHDTRQRAEEKTEYEEEKIVEKTTEKNPPQKQMHPNDLIFPLIYSQSHVNSMFKFGENWYTWATEKRTDGSKATNYYICYDEPKRCDEVGWERTDSVPKCAFQIDSVMADDRACINSYGTEPHPGGLCDGGEQMKVSDMVNACGPRIRSLWRFMRVGRRPSNAAKPADVNSLVCEDEEECYITIEYRIHHDRISFSLHEPTRGQTFKSVLKRDTTEETTPFISEHIPRTHSRAKKVIHNEENPITPGSRKKNHLKPKSKDIDHEGKGLVKDNDSGYSNRRITKNRIKVREDVSEDISE